MNHSRAGFARRLLPLAIATTTAAAAFAPAAGHAAVIEEVTVTAQKTLETLQQTPIAISSVSGDELVKMGATSFSGVAATNPSINFSSYPSSANTLILYMRGQGVSDPMQVTSDGAVGIYVDGFYIARPQAITFDLADIERVEVLRGPQGTLYGRNTTGGAVNVIAKKPSGDFGLKQELTFGTRNQFRSLTSVDLPGWNGVSTKFSFIKSSRDGFVKNTGSSHDYNEESQRAGRFALNWTGLDSISVDYSFETGDLDSTPIYYQSADPMMPVYVPGYVPRRNPASRTYRPIELPESEAKFHGHGLTVTWDATDELSIKSLTGYRELDSYVYSDFADALMVRPYVLQDDIDSEQFSQEFQFIGANADDTLRYVAGLYYFKEKAHRVADVYQGDYAGGVVNTNRDVHNESTSRAVYGQLTWVPGLFDDRLDFTFGGRYTRDDREATRDFVMTATGPLYGPAPLLLDSSEGANDRSFSKFNPAFTVNMAWTDDLNTYLKIATGYKAGGSSEAAPNFAMTFGPEEVTTYEIGVKSYFFDRQLRINAAAFRSDFEDMQMTFPTNPADPSESETLNAGEATINGFELEALAVPTPDLTLAFNWTWLDPEVEKVIAKSGTVFDRDTNPASPYAAGDDIADLFTLPYAPKHSLNASIDYTFARFANIDLAGRLDYRWNDSMALSAPAGSGVVGHEHWWRGAYGILHARLTLNADLARGDRVTVALWGRNIANKRYKEAVVALGSALGGYASQTVAWSEPPSYGVDLSYHY